MSNFIQISEKYAIGSDNRQWMVLKSKKVTDKETKKVSMQWDSKSFHGNLDQAIYELGQLLLRTAGAKNSEELQAAAKEISAMLSQEFAQSSSIEWWGAEE